MELVLGNFGDNAHSRGCAIIIIYSVRIVAMIITTIPIITILIIVIDVLLVIGELVSAVLHFKAFILALIDYP